MTSSDRELIAKRLKDAREYVGFSQEEVSELVGISRSAISLIESGQRKVDSLELKTFARIYGQPVSYLTGDDERLEAPPDIQALARQVSKLSAADRDEVLKFAEYLFNRPKGNSVE